MGSGTRRTNPRRAKQGQASRDPKDRVTKTSYAKAPFQTTTNLREPYRDKGGAQQGTDEEGKLDSCEHLYRGGRCDYCDKLDPDDPMLSAL